MQIMSDQFASVITAFVTAILTGVISYLLQEKKLKSELEAQERKLRSDFDFDVNKIRTDFMAEQVVKRLLQSPTWERRSFETIQRRLGGFDKDEDELRRILVRAGAIRFYSKNDKQEYWGLIERNESSLKDDLGESLR